MKGKLSILLCLLSLPIIQYAQEDSTHKKEKVNSIKAFFGKGHLHGHVRNYFMATQNEGELKDYWTNALGGAIKYETSEWKGIQFGVKGIFTFRTFSSELDDPDQMTKKYSKWEMELYDVTRPKEGRDLDRLEELYIKYNYKDSYITYGKINIDQGPLFLKRDGRMKPFVYRGLWSEIKELEDQVINVGWIHGVSPRGMTEWYPINEAVGILSNGKEPNGFPAHYHEKSETKGIGVIGYQNDILSHVKLQAWHYYFHKMNHTLWLQMDYSKNNLFGGIQYVMQKGAKEQGRLDYEERYYQPNEMANILSVQMGYLFPKTQTKLSASYLHGFQSGRFLFPKELGRENFYVSHPRSWMDGFGKVDVYMLRGEFKPKKGKLKNYSIDLHLAYIDAAKADDFAQNKYGKSDYFQSTLSTKYKFSKVLDGLDIGFIYILRSSPDTTLSPDDIFYKTNFHHINFITNLNF